MQLSKLLLHALQFLNNFLLKPILPLLLYKLAQPSTTLHELTRLYKLVQFFNNILHRRILQAQLYKLAQFINNILHKLILPGLLYKLFQLSTTLHNLTRLHDQADFMQLHDQFLLQPLSGILL